MMKKFILLVFAIVLVMPTIAKNQKEYRVKTVEEFIVALGSDRIIILEQGPAYNITNGFEDDYVAKVITQSKLLNVEYAFDGLELQINDVENLSIRGAGNKPVRLLIEPRYAYVLNFIGCKNITLENLEMGHTPEGGYCTGGVLNYLNSENIMIQNCRLFGCGMEGITLERTTNLRCENTDIYECTYNIFTIVGSSNIYFTNCRFYENQEFEMINVSNDCENIVLDQCLIYDNKGTLFNVHAPIQMKKCQIWHPESSLGNLYYVKQQNCLWK